MLPTYKQPPLMSPPPPPVPQETHFEQVEDALQQKTWEELGCVLGEMVISSDKYEVKLISKSMFEVRMVLVIRNFQQRDEGSYRCIAKNSLGEVESNIRLYDIPGPTRRVFQQPRYDEEDYIDQYGSAEQETDEELSNTVAMRPPSSLGNSASGLLPTLGPPALGTHNTYTENQVPGPPARDDGCSGLLSGPRWLIGAVVVLLCRLWRTF
uniref:(California timema) hypothetical protein n=1 Tax=Timema californicum TaxID=61474 RepID=A0A7R9J256_TIMCA|nr:unnamed protein product [Timema californicum]